MTQLPINSESLAHAKQTVVSNRLRSDRMRDTLAEVGVQAEGDIGFELSFTDFDKILEGALGNSFVSSTTGALTTIDASTTDDSYNRAAGSFVTDGFVVGQYVKVSGFVNSANNGIHKVTAVTATKLSVSENLTTEAAGPSVTIIGKRLRNGTTQKSYLIEKRFEDLTQYISFRGMKVNTLSLNVASQEIVGGNVTFLGKQGYASGSSVPGSSSGYSTNSVLNATSNVGTLTEGGASLTTAIKSIQMQLNNNLRARLAVSNKSAIGVSEGTVDITGTLEAYFEDLTLYNKFVNHTSSSLSFRFTDEAGNVLIFTLPRLYFAEGNPMAPGINQDVMLPLAFTAVRDATTNCEIQIDALAV
jgi:hypothetical protein